MLPARAAGVKQEVIAKMLNPKSLRMVKSFDLTDRRSHQMYFEKRTRLKEPN
jgi:hypothetical protein